MDHRKCDEIADQMVDEINRLEAVIKAYRKMLLALNMAPTFLDVIEEDAYNKKY